MRRENLKVPYCGSYFNVSALIEENGSDWIVCIHGLQSNSNLFGDLLSQPFLNDYSKIALDLIGFGESAKPDEFSYSVEEQAAVVKEAFRLLSFQRAILVGHSLGGMVGVLLLEPLADVLGGFINMEGNLMFSDCGASRDVANSDYAYFRTNLYPQLRMQAASESPQRAAWLQDTPDYAFYKSSQSIVEWSKSEKLIPLFAAGRCPRLFVYGERSSKKLLAVPDSIPTRQVKDAGHFMLIDNPNESFACVEDFLTVIPLGCKSP